MSVWVEFCTINLGAYLKGFIPSPSNLAQLLYASHCAFSQIVMSYSSWLGKSPDTFNRVSNANNDQRERKRDSGWAQAKWR